MLDDACECYEGEVVTEKYIGEVRVTMNKKVRCRSTMLNSCLKNILSSIYHVMNKNFKVL